MTKYKFIFWKEAKEFETQKAAQDEFTYYICWVVGDSDARTEQIEVERVKDEFSKGATRGVVFNTNLDIPEDFFEARPTIKVLYKDEVREFENKNDAIVFLKDKAGGKEYKPGEFNWYSEETRCVFNAWLIEHGCCRVVDTNSKIPEGFYN